MNQDERRFDFHSLGLALKRAREEKGWTQVYVAELVDHGGFKTQRMLRSRDFTGGGFPGLFSTKM